MITLSTLPLPATRGTGADVWPTLTALTPSDILALLEQYKAAANGYGPVATFGSPTGGSGYTNGTYTGVALTGGNGYQVTANITVSGNAVSAVALNAAGVGYAVGDVLTAPASSLGGTGSGFHVAVATVTATTVGTDAQTAGFASGLFAYMANRFAVLAELKQQCLVDYQAPGSPDTVAQDDQYVNPSAELVDNGVASTPQNPANVYIQP